MHTISAGEAALPPLVLLPGYGAGAGFYFRNLDGLAQHFRVHAVDLLGTGMSGAHALHPRILLNLGSTERIRFEEQVSIKQACQDHRGITLRASGRSACQQCVRFASRALSVS